MNIKKAGDREGIQPLKIIYGEEIIERALILLFRKMFEKSEYPKTWNEGEIIPIPKIKKTQIKTEEFRPICLLSTIGKLFERIINKRMYKLAEDNRWIPKFQNGFMKGKSTIHNLMKLQWTFILPTIHFAQFCPGFFKHFIRPFNHSWPLFLILKKIQ